MFEVSESRRAFFFFFPRGELLPSKGDIRYEKTEAHSPCQQAVDPVDDADLGPLVVPADSGSVSAPVSSVASVKGPVVELVPRGSGGSSGAPHALLWPHHAVLRQRRHRFDDGRPRRAVIVEEVPAEQHDVGPVARRQLEDLVEGRERVLLADLVLLPGAQVVVGGDEDAEDGVVVGSGGGVAAYFGLVGFCFEGAANERARGLRERKGKEKKSLKPDGRNNSPQSSLSSSNLCPRATGEALRCRL